MKKGKKLLCLLMAVVLCFSASTPAMAATAPSVTDGSAASANLSKYDKAVSKYRYWLKKNAARKAWRHYDIVDVDGNGIPELLVGDVTTNWVYTVSKSTGKMTRLKKYDNGKAVGNYTVMYNTAKKSFVLYTEDTKNYTYFFYTLNGTKTTRTATFQKKTNSAMVKSFYINGKKYGQSTYLKKLASAKKGYKYMRHMG